MKTILMKKSRDTRIACVVVVMVTGMYNQSPPMP